MDLERVHDRRTAPRTAGPVPPTSARPATPPGARVLSRGGTPPHHARPSGSAAPAPAAASPAPATGSPGGAAAADVPPVERPLDPRAIARASLQASRNASLWWTAAGVALACLAALVVGPQAGAWTLSALLAAGAAVRATRPEPGPVAWSVRVRALDVTVLGLLAVAIAVLAAILPTPED